MITYFLRRHMVVLVAILLCQINLAKAQTAELQNIEPVKEIKLLLVKERISISRKNDYFDATLVTSIIEGLYVSTVENEFGTFYKGPGFPIFYGNGSMNFTQAGGLWISKKDPIPKIKLYVIMGPENQKKHDSIEAAYLAQAVAARDQINAVNSAKGSVVDRKSNHGGASENPSKQVDPLAVAENQNKPKVEGQLTDGKDGNERQEALNKVILDRIVSGDPAWAKLSPTQTGLAAGIIGLIGYFLEKDAIDRNRGKLTFLSVAPVLTLESHGSMLEFKDTQYKNTQ